MTAASYARAIERALAPKMQSPAATFFSDIVGADKVLAGKATRPSGVTANGDALADSPDEEDPRRTSSRGWR